MLPIAVVLLGVLLIVLIRSKESFLETSYYYEAAPGARGARLVCMPESSGTASLGIAVGRAAARATKKACGPTIDHATVNRIAWHAHRKAQRAVKHVIPRICRKYIKPTKTSNILVKPRPVKCKKGLIRKRGRCVRPCGPRRVWDGRLRACKPRRCPKGFVRRGVKCKRIQRPSVKPMKKPGCAPGRVWNPKTRRCQPRSKPCARGFVRKGGKCVRKPKPVRKPGCGSGRKWDPKKKRCVVISGIPGSPGCGPGKVWDKKQKRCKPRNTKKPAAKPAGSPGCGPGKVWDPKQKRCKPRNTKPASKPTIASRGCGPGRVWDARMKACKNRSAPKPASKPTITSRGCGPGRVYDARLKACKPASNAKPERFRPITEEELTNVSGAIKASLIDPSRYT